MRQLKFINQETINIITCTNTRPQTVKVELRQENGCDHDVRKNMSMRVAYSDRRPVLEPRLSAQNRVAGLSEKFAININIITGEVVCLLDTCR